MTALVQEPAIYAPGWTNQKDTGDLESGSGAGVEHGVVAAGSTPALAATTVAVTNPFGLPALVVLTAVGTMTAPVKVNGVVVGITPVAANSYVVPVGGTIALTFSAVGSLAWTWILL